MKKKISIIILFSMLVLTISMNSTIEKGNNIVYRLAGDIVGPQSIEPTNPINIKINILG